MRGPRPLLLFVALLLAAMLARAAMLALGSPAHLGSALGATVTAAAQLATGTAPPRSPAAQLAAAPLRNPPGPWSTAAETTLRTAETMAQETAATTAVLAHARGAAAGEAEALPPQGPAPLVDSSAVHSAVLAQVM